MSKPQIPSAAQNAKSKRRLTAPKIRAMKGDDAQPLVMLTAYGARQAELLDPHCDIILVGDSVAQVIYGLDSTLPVTLDMMIAHGAAVVRGAASTMIVVDMPFGTYETSPRQAFASAARIMAETGCSAVKLEGGEAMAQTIAFLTQRGIPVMGHVGLTPQAVNTLGGYRARGKNDAETRKILADGKAVTDAGAFALVVEGVMEDIADALVDQSPVPVIGIGASARCDGQVLVGEDMLGLFDRTARFVKSYGDLAARIDEAVATYAADVRARAFPSADQTYARKD